MRHDFENATFKPEVITVEVTEDDFIREAEDENAPRILGQLKYFFWDIKHEHMGGKPIQLHDNIVRRSGFATPQRLAMTR
jgi:hypothetical protein